MASSRPSRRGRTRPGRHRSGSRSSNTVSRLQNPARLGRGAHRVDRDEIAAVTVSAPLAEDRLEHAQTVAGGTELARAVDPTMLNARHFDDTESRDSSADVDQRLDLEAGAVGSDLWQHPRPERVVPVAEVG